MGNVFKIRLTAQIMLCMLLGIIIGILFDEFAQDNLFIQNVLVDQVLYFGGNGFIRALQMLVVPLVFASLVSGVCNIGDVSKLSKIGLKTLVFYTITTAVAIFIALICASIFRPGVGLDMQSIETYEPVIAESRSTVDTLLNIIPKNPFASLVEGSMLQIILFAILLGVILAKNGERFATSKNLFMQFNDMMLDMTHIVMRFAPLGIFCLIATTFAQLGFSAFIPLLKYVGVVFLVLIIHCVGVYMFMLKTLSGLSPIFFLRHYASVMGFAFSTSSSAVTIPLAIETLQEKMGVSKSVSSFTIPLGATINMDGTAIMQGVAVVFVAEAFGIDLTMMDYVMVILSATLASIGTAGVPAAGLITLSMVFSQVGLPLEGIALIMGVDRLIDMARTVVNITGDAVCTIIIAKQNGDSLKTDIYN